MGELPVTDRCGVTDRSPLAETPYPLPRLLSREREPARRPTDTHPELLQCAGEPWDCAMAARAQKRDLVEEFWDAGTLESCRADAVPESVPHFLNALREFLGASGRMWPARSGSEALRRFLADALPSGKRHVLVCSFNCRIVADAVRAAGSRVETFDLDDLTGRIDWERIAEQIAPRHGAVIVPHLFGVPADFRPIRAAAARAGALIVEDCAHTLGGTLGNQAAGTVGDAAIFSFNYDKPISLGGGGALLVNEPHLWANVKLDTPSLTVEREAGELKVFLEYTAAPARRPPRPTRRMARPRGSASTNLDAPGQHPVIPQTTVSCRIVIPGEWIRPAQGGAGALATARVSEHRTPAQRQRPLLREPNTSNVVSVPGRRGCVVEAEGDPSAFRRFRSPLRRVATAGSAGGHGQLVDPDRPVPRGTR